MPDRTRLNLPSNPDKHCRQSRPITLAKANQIQLTSVAPGHLLHTHVAKIISSLTFYSIGTPTVGPLAQALTTSSVAADMKISPSLSLASKKTRPTCSKTTSGTENNNDSNMPREEQEEQQKQQNLTSENKDANNNHKDVNAMNSASNNAEVDVCQCPRDSNGNTNLNRNNEAVSKMAKNDNGKDMDDAECFLCSRRRLQRKDSGFYSSASDEDATDKSARCHCGSGAMLGRSSWPRRVHRVHLRKLSISRSQSWSSMDSGVGGSGTTSVYSPSASSLSSLSSLWSLSSSSRNNLSGTPSLDSLGWSSSLSGRVSCGGDSTISETCESSSTVETRPCENQSQGDFDASVSITDRISEHFSPVISAASSPASSALKPEDERNQEDLASGTDDLPATTGDDAVTVTPVVLASVHRRPPTLSRAAGRRHRSRDHNNNADLHRGMGLHEFLPKAPCRLGDFFSTKGIATFFALILYTLFISLVISVMRIGGACLKTAVGKQDLKEMRKSLARSRRSRRSPAMSG